MRLILAVIAGLVLLTGCTATQQQLARNLAGKDVHGSGLVTSNHIGIDANTKLPQLQSIVVTGDFQTITANTNYLRYKQQQSGAWYNAQNKTKKTTLVFTTTQTGNLAQVLKYALELLKTQQTAVDKATK